VPRGSKPGERRGGRKKGTPNKVTLQKAAEIAASGLTPLDYMLSVLRDEEQPPERRDDMAKAAAPYCHPKLAAIEHGGRIGLTFEDYLAGLDGESEGEPPPSA
jgi:hypothetical protein